jgi:hypothetical protein
VRQQQRERCRADTGFVDEMQIDAAGGDGELGEAVELGFLGAP